MILTFQKMIYIPERFFLKLYRQVLVNQIRLVLCVPEYWRSQKYFIVLCLASALQWQFLLHGHAKYNLKKNNTQGEHICRSTRFLDGLLLFVIGGVYLLLFVFF